MKKRIIFYLFLVSVVWLASVYRGRDAEISYTVEEQRSYAEIAAVLEKLEIGGTTEQMIREMEESFSDLPPEVEFNKCAALLTELGGGDFDYSAGTWTPYDNGVYSFDMEVFDLENMYTDFLSGVSALDREELDFKNVREDTSKVNWEKGTGKRTVTFEWKGKTFCLKAKAYNDWFDMGVAHDLNKIIMKNGGGKRLYFTGDGYQGCIVFYRDKEWADAFEKETGLVLE